MRKLIHTILLLALLALGAVGTAHAQMKWYMRDINGIEYVSMKDVCRFYGFSRQEGKAGCLSYGKKDMVISLRPSRQDFYVKNYRYILSYPVQVVGNELYISATDVKKLLDPVLRPHLTRAGKVTTVVLDPGHGGWDPGAESHDSRHIREKDCNLALALKVRDKLIQGGFKVVMTRDRDFFLTLGERVAIANRTPDSIFVSIHHNSGGRAASGIETFTLAPHGTTSPFARTRRTEDLSGNNQDSENIALATAVHSRAIRSTMAPDRGIQRARFSVLCTIRRPAILFEGGFVSHPEEGTKIASSEYQNKLAQSIYEGICGYCARIGKNAARPTSGRPITHGGASLGTPTAPTNKR